MKAQCPAQRSSAGQLVGEESRVNDQVDENPEQGDNGTMSGGHCCTAALLHGDTETTIRSSADSVII